MSPARHRLMRLGIAEIGQQPIAEMLGHMALMTFDRARTGILKRSEQVAVILGIELLGELCRSHQVAEHHREAAARDDDRGPPSAARRVAFPAPSVRRERSPMHPHRLRLPSCRGNGKNDPTCHAITKGGTSRDGRGCPSASRDSAAPRRDSRRRHSRGGETEVKDRFPRALFVIPHNVPGRLC